MAKTSKPTPTKAGVFQQIITFFRTYKGAVMLLAVGFIAGLLWFGSMRYFLVKSPETHYHANFAVYLDGEREKFENFTYYEEVAACTSAYQDNPKGRVHMHDNINDVIHVHDKRVTYGNFFENLGWAVGENFISVRGKLYVNNASKQITYILNGERVSSIADRVIGNKDRLLISYGTKDTNLDEQFDSVATTAEEVNKYQDPTTCGGLNGAGYDSFLSRIKRATFWE